MSSTWDRSGLDRLGRRLDLISRHATVTFAELFTPAFMAANTRVPTLEALFAAGGYEVRGRDDFARIPEAEWEAHVRAHTRFGSWVEMQQAAGEAWVRRRLAP